MEKLKRGDKIFLDEKQEVESFVNTYLDCRDGVVEVYEYNDESGYGLKTRLFYCQDKRHETKSIVRQTWSNTGKVWSEELMVFDSDSFDFLIAIITGKENQSGGKYSLIRDY